MKPLEITPRAETGDLAAQHAAFPDSPEAVPLRPGLAPLGDLRPLGLRGCGCAAAAAPQAHAQGWALRYALFGASGLAAWFVLYFHLERLSRMAAFSALGLAPGSHIGAAVQFFLYDAPKVLMLLSLVVFGVGVLRSYFSPQRTRRLLAGRRESVGNVLAAMLGVVTPFCSCSAVPLFIGFMTSGIPLGVTFSFLIAAPMVNEIGLVLLYGLFGVKVAAIYLATGLAVAVASGWVIGRLNMEPHIQEWVRLARENGDDSFAAMHFKARIDYGLSQVRDIVSKVWIYMLLGIGVGAGIHGFVPEGALTALMGREAWWSVPAAVALGVPMYSNAAGIIPIVHALLEKGAALGTALAFMMSVIALSLPEMIILHKVLKRRLIAAFVGVAATGILLVGFLFNALQ